MEVLVLSAGRRGATAGRAWNALTSGAFLAALIAVAMLCGAASAEAEPEIRVSPSRFYVGSFSTIEPLQSDLIPGSTVVSLSVPDSWKLEILLEGPPRRTTDGLGLPLARLQETNPDVPPEFANLQSYVYNEGHGDDDWIDITGDWLDLAAGLETYLQPGDPAGSYEATLLLRLLDGDGNPTTDRVSMTMEFDIKPWVVFSTSVLPACEVHVVEGEFQGESAIVLVSVASNTAWSLSVRGTGDLVSESGGALPMAALSVCTEESGGGVWRPWRSECEVVQPNAVTLVVGDEPEPFLVTYEEIPVFLRFEGEPPLSAGRYGTSLEFEVTAMGFDR